MRARRLAAGACAAALVAAGCSGGGSGSFEEQANEICAEYDERIADVELPTSPEDLAASATEIAELTEQGTAELRELEAPDESQGAWEEWLELSDGAAESARDIAAAAERGEEDRIRELAPAAEENERASDELAGELGLDECVLDEGE